MTCKSYFRFSDSFVHSVELAYKALHYSQREIMLYRAQLAHMDYFVDRLSVPRHVQQAELLHARVKTGLHVL